MLKNLGKLSHSYRYSSYLLFFLLSLSSKFPFGVISLSPEDLPLADLLTKKSLGFPSSKNDSISLSFFFCFLLFGYTGSSLWQVGSLVAAFELLVAACMWDLVP